MAKTKRLSACIALILAITLAAIFPARALAFCGPAIAGAAVAAPAVGSALIGVLSTVGTALGLVQTAKQIIGPEQQNASIPVCTNAGCLAHGGGHNPAGASYAQPVYVDPGYQAGSSQRSGLMEPSGATPY